MSDIIKKELFIRPYSGKLKLEGELELGWKFTDSSGESIELIWGQIGIGKGTEDREKRLANIITELRKRQKELGNDNFMIDRIY